LTWTPTTSLGKIYFFAASYSKILKKESVLFAIDVLFENIYYAIGVSTNALLSMCK
jgi:hypothetical protein